MKESDSIIGKHILVGLTYLDPDGNIEDRIELHIWMNLRNHFKFRLLMRN
ncbi:MAG: hypothetical protein GY749_49950 [Desulfobacteraceae bacterium]|nr:hypothetical protein [Desulfobacteraceae bacterium]